ncbi:transposase family protein [Streptomyces sp. SID8352]|uniref:transposase family protein n=1 Tax=Streptomyces sp. SID8352 TaxID=2690338 RepID=UPI0013690C65|nr:transposase family protein [Streptomyces sp. SID8352]MYU24046.1 hypothetical protein [Streptomyces sp. SID8352]
MKRLPSILGVSRSSFYHRRRTAADRSARQAADAKPAACLATVIDLSSRRLAGWAIADHMRADLVTDALDAAVRTRGSLVG